MTFVRALCLRVLEAAGAFFIFVSIPQLPPPMNFTSISVAPAMPLKGLLALNTQLNNAEHLFEGDIKGPEAMVPYNGSLYTGVHGGYVMKLQGSSLHPITKFGVPCEGIWEERKCGRPLGMKFGNHDDLYVADAYYGIFKFHLKTNVWEKLIDMHKNIEGRPPKLPNSLDIASDGSIYWSDSSSDISLENGVYGMLGDGTGRLIKYDPKTRSNKVLLDHIQFANGVVMSPNEDYVLVAETAQSRIHRYYLKGPKNGTADIFIEGLPGLPDNLKSDGEGGFFVPLIFARDSSTPSLNEVLGPYPLVRKFLARLLALVEMPFHYINEIYPNYYTKRVVHWVGHFESVSMLAPKRTTIVQLDVNGKVKNSLHCLDGSLSGISDIAIHKGAYYFGSPYNGYIGRVKVFSEEEEKLPNANLLYGD